MPQVIKITQKPTFDLDDIDLISFDADNALLYLKTNQVFFFDGVFGNLENRSRVLRTNKDESKYIEQIISATIDAGFCGQLVWKIKLTIQGKRLLQQIQNPQEAINYFRNAQQLHLFPCPAGNYYQGSNQTNKVPDVIFKV